MKISQEYLALVKKKMWLESKTKNLKKELVDKKDKLHKLQIKFAENQKRLCVLNNKDHEFDQIVKLKEERCKNKREDISASEKHTLENKNNKLWNMFVSIRSLCMS